MQTPSLISQQRDIRQTGINPNHWYAVARSSEVTTNPIAVTLWQQAIAIYRGNDGKVYALEDRCPHRQVKLSHGRVVDNNIECAYHGWHIGGNGECVAVPYLAANQKLPNCKIRHYPVREQDGFIWIFPGDSNISTQIQPLGLPEWDHLNYIATVSIIECTAHYSYLIENLMDMYHGHLHQSWQAWADPVLQDIYEDNGRVDAHYQAQSYYKIDKIWSISQLFFPALRRLHPEPLDVSYIYPNWTSTLGNDFKIYCLFCPINDIKTRAYLIHFTSLNAFWRLHKLPVAFRKFVKNSLFGSAQKLLDGLVLQDVQMIEEEQQAYLAHPEQKNHELNRALVSVQKLIRSQANTD
ncbi:aromatic ring-hydroxylating dioxygenase subunit alpha [Scytonema millei]|uniref:Aromatic ring-hydroxylating dioxygenase subunit alpha n=1 Tax=Scytonema millei VB511283 TaxID=1245923 RepID=A0A9X5E4J8_9CYAN|nr:aromatic ring-hydroxylating dioxygenase subunit alpha [Scytonema millei]NHC35141.1 aromatic ring-hydroxylating dioxygenase subunit alpha [Scytonema millei VB511283]